MVSIICGKCMPVAFGLGFQNHFHLLSLNQGQPRELGVGSSAQTSLGRLAPGVRSAGVSSRGPCPVLPGPCTLVIAASPGRL